MTKQAQAYLDSALALSKEIGSKDDIKESYASLAVLDSLSKPTARYAQGFDLTHRFYFLFVSLNAKSI